MTTLRDGSTISEYGGRTLDRIPVLDPRSVSREYAASGYLDLDKPIVPVTRAIRGRGLDQGSEGACTAFGIGGIMNQTDPVEGQATNEACVHLYWEIQRNDEFDGGAYPGAKPRMDGSSCLASLKQAQRAGIIDSYHAIRNLRELAHALQINAVYVGYVWQRGMFKPDSKGYIHPTGPVEGGHALSIGRLRTHTGEALPADCPDSALRDCSFGFLQSWGDDLSPVDGPWVWITGGELEEVMEQQGEQYLILGEEPKVLGQLFDAKGYIDPNAPAPKPKRWCGSRAKMAALAAIRSRQGR